jgi:hypothetical protein
MVFSVCLETASGATGDAATITAGIMETGMHGITHGIIIGDVEVITEAVMIMEAVEDAMITEAVEEMEDVAATTTTTTTTTVVAQVARNDSKIFKHLFPILS